jgi:ABC-type spermidine/putrescine transport system permease subunit II
MTWGDRLGTFRFYQNMGDPLAHMVRESVKPALGTTALATYLGASPSMSIVIGIGTVAAFLALAIAFGYVVVRYRIIHSQITQEWQNNPLMLRQIALLEAIEKNTCSPADTSGYTADPHVTYRPKDARVRFSDGQTVDWSKAL